MRYLISFLSFFLITQLYGQIPVQAGYPDSTRSAKALPKVVGVGSCLRHNKLPFTHPLQHLDCKGHRTYPVSLSKKQVRIIVVPHSVDEHSQCLAAATYQVLQKQTFDTIILISQDDCVSFHGVALPCMVEDFSCFKRLYVDSVQLKKISKGRLFRYYQAPFSDNQGLQLQCIFLNYYLRNIALIPLIVGQICLDDAAEIAAVVAEYCTDQTLIVLSADIAKHRNCTHDYPLDQSKVCKIYDNDALAIQAMQSGVFSQQVALFQDTCASPVFAILFELLRLSDFKNLESTLVGYTTNSCTTADDMHIEDIKSYAAFIMQYNESGYKNNIGFYEQSQLLQCARCGLDSLFEVPAYRLPCMISYEMAQSHGIFSSLYTMSDHGTMLRGCMGKMRTKFPLHEMVYQMTAQAACKDFRFSPLRHKEIGSTIISLSVIIDFEKISKVDQIDRFDGVMLQYDDKIAVSLPSTVSIRNWNYESTLMNLSDQMGSHRFVWKKPRAKIFTFRSLIFQEE